MHRRARSWTILANGLLAVSLLTAPGVAGATPSSDDPAATVNALLDAIVAKDFAGIGPLACAEKRDALTTRFDLKTQFSSLGEGVDVEALFAGITITTPGRTVSVVSQDDATATVTVSGSLALEITDEAARTFVGQLLESQGMEVTEATLDQYTPLMVGQIEQTKDLTKTIDMVYEDGAWRVCGGFDDDAPPASPPASATPSDGPAASLPPMDADALAALMQTIPADLRTSCVPDGYWQIPELGPEPGEIASVDCDPDGDGGDFASYSLFATAESMNAFYDQQLLGMRNLGALDGPGCPEGPGEAAWEHGRRFCYQPFGDDANMRWTHDALFIVANAINDDGDWAALETFFAAAGPQAS